MNIIGIKAERIKKLTLVDLKLDGTSMVVAGKPGEGKTTLINLVWMALSAKYCGKEVIQKGEKSAYITLTLGEPGKEYTVNLTRSFVPSSPDAGVIRVTRSDKKALPPNFKEELLCSLAFDPLEFVSKKGLEQVNMLLQCAGLNFQEADELRDKLYEDRRVQKQDLARAKAMAGDEPPESEYIDVTVLSKEMAAAKAHNDNVEEKQKILDQLKSDHEEVVNNIKDLQKALADAIEEEAVLGARITKGEEVMAKPHMQIIDTNEQLTKLTNAQLINEKHRKRIQWLDNIKLRDDSQATVDDTQAKIDAIDANKRQALATAPWPIKGLGVRDGDVIYNDTLLKSCGTSDQMKVSFAVATTLNPKLKACRLDGAESLGAEGRAAVLKLAENQGYQVFMSRVSDSGAEDNELVIEDGTINNN